MTTTMIEFLTTLFKDINVRQRDFVKSFIVAFPLVYTFIMDRNETFLSHDLFSRCMETANMTLTIMFITIFFLFVDSGFRRRMRVGVAYYIGAAFLSISLALTATSDYDVLCSIIKAHGIIFMPIILYDIILKYARRLDKSINEVIKSTEGTKRN